MAAEDAQRSLLLCKPCSQAVHHILAQEVRTAGLDIVDRLFHVSPEQALALVLQYPPVKARMAERAIAKPHPAPNTAASNLNEKEEEAEATADLPEFIRAAQRHRQRQRLPGAAAAYATPSAAAPTGGASPLWRNARPPDHGLLNHIQHLAQGGKLHPSTTAAASAAGAPTALPRLLSTAPSSAEDRQRQQGSSGPSASPHPTTATNESSTNEHSCAAHRATGASRPAVAYRRSHMSFPAADGDALVTALDTLLDHPALSDRAVRRHVEHLVQDGTVLVLLVRGADAVEKLAALCGPENVAAAQQAAPESWTARFGDDDVHNAVYAPRTAADAQAAIASLFPRSGAADRTGRAGGAPRTHAHFPTLLPPSQATAAAAAAATSSTHAADSAAALTPTITFAALLPSLRAQIGATHRLSHYIGTASVKGPSMRSGADASHIPTPLSASVGRSDGGGAPTPTAALTHSATARCSSAAPFPERRERLDELTQMLGKRAVA